jgi:hypothetical protein
MQNGTELGIIHLANVTLVRQSSRKNKKHCFEIWTPERTYYMIAASDADRDSWIDTITIAKKALEARKTQNPGNSTTPHEEKITIKDFDLLNVVGKGSFGKVMQVRKKDTGKVVFSFPLKVSILIHL